VNHYVLINLLDEPRPGLPVFRGSFVRFKERRDLIILIFLLTSPATQVAVVRITADCLPAFVGNMRVHLAPFDFFITFYDIACLGVITYLWVSLTFA
jgi:hypothetical protein